MIKFIFLLILALFSNRVHRSSYVPQRKIANSRVSYKVFTFLSESEKRNILKVRYMAHLKRLADKRGKKTSIRRLMRIEKQRRKSLAKEIKVILVVHCSLLTKSITYLLKRTIGAN